jgi:hypothetical protein
VRALSYNYGWLDWIPVLVIWTNVTWKPRRITINWRTEKSWSFQWSQLMLFFLIAEHIISMRLRLREQKNWSGCSHFGFGSYPIYHIQKLKLISNTNLCHPVFSILERKCCTTMPKLALKKHFIVHICIFIFVDHEGWNFSIRSRAISCHDRSFNKMMRLLAAPAISIT